jgi:hypothetical protein
MDQAKRCYEIKERINIGLTIRKDPAGNTTVIDSKGKLLPSGSDPTSVIKRRIINKKVIDPQPTNTKHPHAADTTEPYHRDYYTVKVWNIESRFY